MSNLNFTALFNASISSAIAASVQVTDEIVKPYLANNTAPLMHFKSQYDVMSKGDTAQARFIKANFATFFKDFCPNRLGVEWDKEGNPDVATVDRYTFNPSTNEYGKDVEKTLESNLRILNSAHTPNGIAITENSCPMSFKNKRDDKGNAWSPAEIEKAIKATMTARDNADKATKDGAHDADEKELKAYRMETALVEKIASANDMPASDALPAAPTFNAHATTESTVGATEMAMDEDKAA